MENWDLTRDDQIENLRIHISEKEKLIKRYRSTIDSLKKKIEWEEKEIEDSKEKLGKLLHKSIL